MSNPAVFIANRAGMLEAEPLMKQALAIVERAQGPNHSDVGMLLDLSVSCSNSWIALKRRNPCEFVSSPSLPKLIERDILDVPRL